MNQFPVNFKLGFIKSMEIYLLSCLKFLRSFTIQRIQMTHIRLEKQRKLNMQIMTNSSINVQIAVIKSYIIISIININTCVGTRLLQQKEQGLPKKCTNINRIVKFSYNTRIFEYVKDVFTF